MDDQLSKSDVDDQYHGDGNVVVLRESSSTISDRASHCSRSEKEHIGTVEYIYIRVSGHEPCFCLMDSIYPTADMFPSI